MHYDEIYRQSEESSREAVSIRTCFLVIQRHISTVLFNRPWPGVGVEQLVYRVGPIWAWTLWWTLLNPTHRTILILVPMVLPQARSQPAKTGNALIATSALHPPPSADTWTSTFSRKGRMAFTTSRRSGNSATVSRGGLLDTGSGTGRVRSPLGLQVWTPPAHHRRWSIS